MKNELRFPFLKDEIIIARKYGKDWIAFIFSLKTNKIISKYPQII